MTFQKRLISVLMVMLGVLASTKAADRMPESLEVVKELIATKKAVLLDVRERDEWELGHLADAIHLPTSSINEGMTSEDLARIAGKDAVIYLHCKAGRCAADAAKRLKSTGRDLRALKTGYYGLIEAGFPKANP